MNEVFGILGVIILMMIIGNIIALIITGLLMICHGINHTLNKLRSNNHESTRPSSGEDNKCP